MTMFRWTPEQVAAIGRGPHPVAPRFAADQAPRVTPGLDLWDHWPVLTPEGALAEVAGGLLVVALTAPIFADPEERHGHARLRLLHRGRAGWRDLGDLLPDGLSPGSREWAGSTILERDGRLTLYFTAAGQRGEPVTSFDQRLFACTIALDTAARPIDWSPLTELVAPDGAVYEAAMAGGGAVGTIKAFRDPCYLQDGDDEWLLFAASRAGSRSPWNGLVGAARRSGGAWRLEDPLVDATGVNNELERPHALRHRGALYLFWSTQRKVFAPELRHAPTGLYGVVRLPGTAAWRPINGSGLVFANPAEAPAQAYSWQVLPDLTVWSFADRIAPAGGERAAPSFAGAPAPVLSLRLEGDRASL